MVIFRQGVYQSRKRQQKATVLPGNRAKRNDGKSFYTLLDTANKFHGKPTSAAQSVK